MDWPRCSFCHDLMCCDGKGNYECVCAEALREIKEDWNEIVRQLAHNAARTVEILFYNVYHNAYSFTEKA